MKNNKFYFFFLFLSFLSYSQPGNHVPIDGTYLYRGDTRSPSKIKRAGGFLSWAITNNVASDDVQWSLFSYQTEPHNSIYRTNSPYVSLTSNYSIAYGFADSARIHSDPVPEYVYVYVVAASSSASINVNSSLGSHSFYAAEREIVEAGSIPFSRVYGVYRLSTANMQDFRFFRMTSTFELPEDNGAPPAFPELAGFPAGHIGWTEQPWSELSQAEDCRVVTP